MSDFEWPEMTEPLAALVPDDPSGLTDTSNRIPARLGANTVPWSTVGPSMLDKLEAIADNPHAMAGLSTGFGDVDRLLHGLQKGRFYLVAALTGAGKSVLLGDLFRHWMSGKVPCALITLEMDREEVWRRQAAAACRIDHGRLQDGNLTDGDWSKLARWIADTDDSPVWICDSTRATVADLSELIRYGAAELGWQAVLIDYAQKIHAAGHSREQAVAGIATGLKEIARVANIPVVVGAQLNREANKRPGGVPKLSDLRESAALEHETDAAILIHRPDYDDPESPRAGEADLIVAKNRGGARGTVTVAAQLHWQRFVPFAAEELTTCVACYAQHPGAAGSACRACAGKSGRQKPP